MSNYIVTYEYTINGDMVRERTLQQWETFFECALYSYEQVAQCIALETNVGNCTEYLVAQEADVFRLNSDAVPLNLILTKAQMAALRFVVEDGAGLSDSMTFVTQEMQDALRRVWEMLNR
jgi:hypothetical protein